MSRTKRSRHWRPWHSVESTGVRRWHLARNRARAKQAMREGREPERVRGTQGWDTW